MLSTSSVKKSNTLRLIDALVQFALGSVLLESAQVRADAFLDEPFALSERAPHAQRFNLPGMRSGELLSQGAIEWRESVDLANNFLHEAKGNEKFGLDGESQRYELGVRYGIAKDWDIGVALPWISYNGGALDHFIENWHRALGFGSGGRKKYARNQLQVSYQHDGYTELNFNRAEAGFGDTQIQLANQLLQTSTDAIALIATLNLPTGDENKLTGAGGTAGGIAVAATHSNWFDLPLTLSGNLGVQTLPHGDVLDDRQRDYAWYGSAEIAWATAADWRLRTQINAHTALYDSPLKALGENSVQMLVGGTVRVADHWALDIVVGEDINVDTAPDVTIQLALKSRY